MGGTSLHKFQQLSTDTAVSIEKSVRTLQRLQSQLDSLATMVLQNRWAPDLLTAGQGGTCLYLKNAVFITTSLGRSKKISRGFWNRPQRSGNCV